MVEPIATETAVEAPLAEAPAEFVPSAPGVPSGTARFGIIGDFAEGPDLLDVSNVIKGWSPDFIVTVGDNTYGDIWGEDLDDDVGQYFHSFIYPYVGSYGQGATSNKFWPTLGNHDWVVINEYLSYFTLPGNERYYEFARGPVDFFILDSDTHEPDGYRQNSAQAAWFHAAIAASPYPWKLVFLHNPPYTSGSSFPSNTNVQWPFKSWGASAVFAGHNHVYERIVPPTQGILFFVNGLGGSTISDFNSSQVAGEQFRYNNDFGAMRVDATHVRHHVSIQGREWQPDRHGFAFHPDDLRQRRRGRCDVELHGPWRPADRHGRRQRQLLVHGGLQLVRHRDAVQGWIQLHAAQQDVYKSAGEHLQSELHRNGSQLLTISGNAGVGGRDPEL